MPNTHDLTGNAQLVALQPEEDSWLERLKSDWQVLADLASADLILWLPTTDGRFYAAAMCRPATSMTVHVDDVVGLFASATRAALLREAMDTREIVNDDSVQWSGLYSIQRSCVPVMCNGRCIALMSVERNTSAPMGQVDEQVWMQSAAEIILGMIVTGHYPSEETPSRGGHGVPRVVDGPILIDPEGIVVDITPNANSAMRRLGLDTPLEGRSLIEEVTKVIRHEHRVDEALALVLMGRANWNVNIEAGGTIISVRAIPLQVDGKRWGAVLLTRDVTEQHRHEQQLMTKDATIREIHHRVKNNLQTVSALLRIQERRSDSEDVQDALREAGRRVESIAVVHEALSHNVDEVVDFDEISQKILTMAVKVATIGHEVGLEIVGKFGRLSADQASALATVLTELIANSVEHGYPEQAGTVWVRAHREGDDLEVRVEDAGEGIDVSVLNRGLGTRIAKSMVQGELGGTIEWAPHPEGGTVATLRMRAECAGGR